MTWWESEKKIKECELNIKIRVWKNWTLVYEYCKKMSKYFSKHSLVKYQIIVNLKITVLHM